MSTRRNFLAGTAAALTAGWFPKSLFSKPTPPAALPPPAPPPTDPSPFFPIYPSSGEAAWCEHAVAVANEVGRIVQNYSPLRMYCTATDLRPTEMPMIRRLDGPAFCLGRPGGVPDEITEGQFVICPLFEIAVTLYDPTGPGRPYSVTNDASHLYQKLLRREEDCFTQMAKATFMKGRDVSLSQRIVRIRQRPTVLYYDSGPWNALAGLRPRPKNVEPHYSLVCYEELSICFLT